MHSVMLTESARVRAMLSVFLLSETEPLQIFLGCREFRDAPVQLSYFRAALLQHDVVRNHNLLDRQTSRP